MHNLNREESMESVQDSGIVDAKHRHHDQLLEDVLAMRTLSPTSVQDVVVSTTSTTTATNDDETITGSPVRKSSFVIDWLKQLVDSESKASNKIAFTTPTKSSTLSHDDDDDDSSLLINSSLKTLPPIMLLTKQTPQSKDTTLSVAENSSTTSKSSPFQQHSEAVGAGWNARGLTKATKQDWEGALKCWENALSIRIQVLGPHHKDVANTRNNAGIALGRLGRETEALQQLQQALEIRIMLSNGMDHADSAATLHNIANVLQQQGHYEEALERFTEAKRIHQVVYGEHTIQVARAWNAIGHLHYHAEQYGEARNAFRHALATFERALENDENKKENIEVQHTKMDLQEVEELLLSTKR